MPEAKESKEKAPKPREMKLCQSGNGKPTTRRYSPGGDARHKSDLITRVISGDPAKEDKALEVKRLESLGYDNEYIHSYAPGVITAKRAEEVLEELGWTSFLTRKRQILAEKEAKKVAAAKAREEKKAAEAAAKSSDAA